jgi:hypothetical protein
MRLFPYMMGLKVYDESIYISRHVTLFSHDCLMTALVKWLSISIDYVHFGSLPKSYEFRAFEIFVTLKLETLTCCLKGVFDPKHASSIT